MFINQILMVWNFVGNLNPPFFLLLMFVVAENNICVDKNLMKKKSLSLSLLYRVYFSNINKLYGPLNVLSTWD